MIKLIISRLELHPSQIGYDLTLQAELNEKTDSIVITLKANEDERGFKKSYYNNANCVITIPIKKIMEKRNNA